MASLGISSIDLLLMVLETFCGIYGLSKLAFYIVYCGDIFEELISWISLCCAVVSFLQVSVVGETATNDCKFII